MRTFFTDGMELFANWLNALSNHDHDGTDFDGHCNKINLTNHVDGQLQPANATPITALITNEQNARIAADTAEGNARVAAVSAEATSRISADVNLGNGIKNHTHSGGSGVPSKINLASEVTGLLPIANMAGFTISPISATISTVYLAVAANFNIPYVKFGQHVMLYLPHIYGTGRSGNYQLVVSGAFPAPFASEIMVPCVVAALGGGLEKKYMGAVAITDSSLTFSGLPEASTETTSLLSAMWYANKGFPAQCISYLAAE
jgi:hypothetical protein